MESKKRKFIRSHKAWYAKSLPNDNASITIRYGTSGEFEIEWESLSCGEVPRLKAFEDSWATLAEFPDLFAKMKEIDGDNISEDDFAVLLIELGIEDVTEYETPNKYKTYTFVERYWNYIKDGKTECREEKVLFEILKDFTDRRGLGQEWSQIDEEIQNEILEIWYDIITKW
jgi:hypothetical protein